MKRLKILPWFLALALILVIVYSTRSRDISPGTRVDASLVFHDRQPAVQAMINGKGPYLLLIYPTARELILEKNLAEELDLPLLPPENPPDPEKTDNETVSRVRNDRIRFGDLKISDISAVVEEFPDRGTDLSSPRGAMGLSLFAPYLVNVDITGQSISLDTGELHSDDDGKTVSFFLNDDKDFTVPLQVGETQFTAQLDWSGNGGIILNKDHIENLSLLSKPEVTGFSRNDDGEFPLWSARFEGTARIGGQDLDTRTVRFLETVPDALLMGDALAEFVITIDQENRRIRFEKEEGRDQSLLQKAARVPNLASNQPDLRTAFNAEPDKIRLLLILSPT